MKSESVYKDGEYQGETGELWKVNLKYVFFKMNYDRSLWEQLKWWDKFRYWFLFKVIFPESVLVIKENKEETK